MLIIPVIIISDQLSGTNFNMEKAGSWIPFSIIDGWAIRSEEGFRLSSGGLGMRACDSWEVRGRCTLLTILPTKRGDAVDVPDVEIGKRQAEEPDTSRMGR